jgi:hypothetical protein
MMSKVIDLQNWSTYELESYRVERCPITGLHEAELKYHDKRGVSYLVTFIPDPESPRFELSISNRVVKL